MNNGRKCYDYQHIEVDPPTGHGWLGPSRQGTPKPGEWFVGEEGMLEDDFHADYQEMPGPFTIHDDVGSVEPGAACPVCGKQTCPVCGMVNNHAHRYYEDETSTNPEVEA